MFTVGLEIVFPPNYSCTSAGLQANLREFFKILASHCRISENEIWNYMGHLARKWCEQKVEICVEITTAETNRCWKLLRQLVTIVAAKSWFFNFCSRQLTTVVKFCVQQLNYQQMATLSSRWFAAPLVNYWLFNSLRTTVGSCREQKLNNQLLAATIVTSWHCNFQQRFVSAVVTSTQISTFCSHHFLARCKHSELQIKSCLRIVRIQNLF